VLVDVVKMRSLGVRLTPAQMRAIAPVRGVLQVMTRTGHDSRGQRVVVAMLLTSGALNRPLLPTLDYVRLTRMEGDRFVLFGFEEVQPQTRQWETHPQSWLCRLVLPGAGVGSEAFAALEDEDEQQLSQF
jgi:hypothetical protein